MTTLIPKFDFKNGGSTPTGAINRPINEKLQETISVTDFGAVGDGTTDDTAAIQAAHDALPSTGGNIYFPPGGFWKVASTINITKSGVTLLGQGQGSASIIYVTSQNFNIFNVSGGNFTAQNISFSVVSATSGYAFYITGDSAYITNVFSLGATSFLYHSGSGLIVNAVNVSNSKIDTGIGIDLRNANANSVVILSNSNFSNEASAITQAFAGVYASEFGSLQIANCSFLAMGAGLYVTPGNGQSAVGIQVTNVFFDNCNQGAYLITSGTGFIPQGVFSNCWFGSSYVGSGIFMQGTSTGLVEGIAISNCQILANAGDGITLANSYVKDINITSNLIYANTNGINVYPNVNNFLISGNQIGDVIGAGNTDYGIQVQTGTSNKYIITSNYIQGNGVVNLRDLGTGVDKVVANNLT